MSRALWFAAGAGAGVYAMIRGRRAAEVFTADGARDRWQALSLGARLFRDEVAAGKAEAETRLRERFGPTYDSTPQLTSGLDTPSLVPHDGGSTNEEPSLVPHDGGSTNEEPSLVPHDDGSTNEEPSLVPHDGGSTNATQEGPQ